MTYIPHKTLKICIILNVFTEIITIMLFWSLDTVQDIGWLKIPGEVTLVKTVTSKSKVVLDIVVSDGKSIVYQSVKSIKVQ